MSFTIDVRGLVRGPMGASVVLERYTITSRWWSGPSWGTAAYWGTSPAIDLYGEPQVPTATTSTVRMVVHPTEPEVLEREGLDHAFAWSTFYALEELRTVSQSGVADVLQHGGRRWEVQKAEPYGTLGGIWIAFAKRLE